MIQEHHARRLHWDFRLERDGVLVSWALPRGVPVDPEGNRLAVRTEDHPLDYIDFAGVIPKGQYGGGQVTIWDAGVYEAEKWEQRKVVVRLDGERVRGRYALFATRGKDWIIHRMDPPDPGDPLPRGIEPMLATTGDLPADDEGWGFEVGWQGLRAIALYDPGQVRLDDAGGEQITGRFPELGAIACELGACTVALDGVLVAFDDHGHPSAERLRARIEASSESAVRRLAAERPVTYVIFDLLHSGRESLLELEYAERRERLEQLGLEGAAWQTPSYHRGDGRALLQVAAQRGLDGIFAKRLDSAYRPGAASEDWLRVAAGQSG